MKSRNNFHICIKKHEQEDFFAYVKKLCPSFVIQGDRILISDKVHYTYKCNYQDQKFVDLYKLWLKEYTISYFQKLKNIYSPRKINSILNIIYQLNDEYYLLIDSSDRYYISFINSDKQMIAQPISIKEIIDIFVEEISPVKKYRFSYLCEDMGEDCFLIKKIIF